MRHLMDVLLQLWFWLTPVVYSYENSLAGTLHQWHIATLYFLNPITLIVLTFQRIFYVRTSVVSTLDHTTIINTLPTWPMSTYFYMNVGLLTIMIVLFLIAVTIFGRLEGNFESEL
jgi:ABC-2 type transport system permease protein